VSVLEDLARQLGGNRKSARALVEEALARAADPAREGARAFLSLDAAGAIEHADHSDRLRRRGRAPSRFAGIPISVKDLFDLAGEVTTAGSVILKGAPPAAVDALAIARLKAFGFIVLGRTNMTEFAYSGLGLNPHYGTPLCIYDRATGRMPGGSSSGAAISVADAICPLGIGTDTGGSCRIPAAFNGIVGWKSTVGRVPTRGVYPLSTTLDSVGPLARSVTDCFIADCIMADDEVTDLEPMPPGAMRLGVLRSLVLDDLELPVARDFERALECFAEAGLRLDDVSFEALTQFPAINAKGGIGASEAYAHHAPAIAVERDGYDPRVVNRILHGAAITAAELIGIHRWRAELIAQFNMMADGYDAVVLPTTPIIAPPLGSIASDDDYIRINMRSLRNTIIGNFLGACAISLPMSEPAAPPTGLMLMARGGSDRRLFRVARGVETVLATQIGEKSLTKKV
jgi:aspartyl-tRNA(Asn)/glutamyl-tRNA(Gln) amidotransferase subunit A